jgi:hypothetical protein
VRLSEQPAKLNKAVGVTREVEHAVGATREVEQTAVWRTREVEQAAQDFKSRWLASL